MNFTKNLKRILFTCGVLFGSLTFGQSNSNSTIPVTKNEVKVVKNIEKGEIQLQIKDAKADQGVITISNKSGKVFLEEGMELNPTTSYFTFKTEGFDSGKYLVNIKSELEIIKKEIVIN